MAWRVTMRIADDVTQLVGHTPLVQLNHIPGGRMCRANRCEAGGMNPAASKDRIGVSMIRAAEEAGLIQPGKPF